MDTWLNSECVKHISEMFLVNAMIKELQLGRGHVINAKILIPINLSILKLK
jgi:hypothetical protein